MGVSNSVLNGSELHLNGGIFDFESNCDSITAPKEDYNHEIAAFSTKHQKRNKKYEEISSPEVTSQDLNCNV